MAKLHWNPWGALEEIGQELERMAGEGATPGGRASRCEKGYYWTPVADMVETAEAFVISLEIPGVPREDVAVEARGRFLFVHGERRCEKEAPGGLYQVMERSYGPFLRRFPLPKGIVRAEIGAVIKDGLLLITLPKVGPERLRRRIPIS